MVDGILTWQRARTQGPEEDPSRAADMTDLVGRTAPLLSPAELGRLGAVSRKLAVVARHPNLWQPHLLALAPPQRSPAVADPRAAWLAAHAPHHLGPAQRPPIVRPGHDLLAIAVVAGRVAASWSDAALNLWDAAEGTLVCELEGHPDAVSHLAADDGLVVGAGETFSARVWQASSGRLRHTLSDDAGGVVSLALRGPVLVTGGVDARMRVWSTPEGQLLHTLDGDGALPRLLALSDAWVVSVSRDRDLRIVSLADGRPAHALQAPSTVEHVAVSDDVVIAAGGLGMVWDAASGAPLREAPMDPGADIYTAAAAHREAVVLGTERGHVDVWTAPWRRPRSFLSPEPGLTVNRLVLRGDVLLACHRDGTVRVASLVGRRIRHPFLMQSRAYRARSGDKDMATQGDVLAIAASDAVALWRFNQPPPPRTWRGALLDALEAAFAWPLHAVALFLSEDI